jgi:hypothetical protein
MKPIECLIKSALIFFLFHIPYSLAYSQSNMPIQWQHCFGGSNIDAACDIIAIDNGYIIAGGTGSNDGDVSFSYGLGDGWLIKTDSAGNLIWEKTYGGSDSEGFSRIIPTSDNNFYLLGISWSSDGDISNDPYPDSPDYWIVKIDSSGNILWNKILGGNYGENLWNGAATADGGVVAIGETSSNDGDVSIFYGGNDTWLVKLTSEGELEWDYSIGTDFFDIGQAIIQTSDGGFLAASSSILLEGGSGNITCIPHTYGWVEGVVFKLDSNLNVEWQHCYGGSDHDGIFGIIEIDDGYVITGGTASNDGDVYGFHGENDIWIVKIDFNGNIIWQKCLGGSRSEGASVSIKNNDGNLIIVGSTRSNNGDVTGNHSLSEFDHDVWLVKLNSEGELLSQQCFGGAGSEIIEFGVVKKSDNNFVIAGYTDYGPSFDVGCTPHGGNYVDKDYWVFEIDSLDTTGVVKNHYENEVMKVFPNPAEDFVEFQVPGSILLTAGQIGSEIRVLSVMGEEVAKILVKTERVVWDCRYAKEGIYFYSLKVDERWINGKIIVLR